MIKLVLTGTLEKLSVLMVAHDCNAIVMIKTRQPVLKKLVAIIFEVLNVSFLYRKDNINDCFLQI